MRFREFSGIIAKSVSALNYRELEANIEKVAVTGESNTREISLKVAYEVFKTAFVSNSKDLFDMTEAQKISLSADSQKREEFFLGTDLPIKTILNFWEKMTVNLTASRERLNEEEKAMMDEIVGSVRMSLFSVLQVKNTVEKPKVVEAGQIFRDPKELAELQAKLKREGKIL